MPRGSWRAQAKVLCSLSECQSAEPAAVNLSLTSPHPAKKGEIRFGRGRTQGGGSCGVGFRFSQHARKTSVYKNQKRMGMDHESESLLLTVLIPVSVNVSIVAGRCRVLDYVPSCINGDSKGTGMQGATTTAEPVAASEELTPAKKPETTVKASPAPAKPKASPVPTGATAEPAASPEEMTPAKQPEATAKPRLLQRRRSRRQLPPPLGQVLLRNLHKFNPQRWHQRLLGRGDTNSTHPATR